MNKLDPYNSYVPVLKAKMGELSALKELNPQTALKVVPLLEIPSVSWDFVESKPKETAKQLLGRVLPYIQSHWGENEFFLDFYGEPSMYEVDESGTKIAQMLVDSLENTPLNYIPVLSFDYPIEYLESLSEKLVTADRGGALRVSFSMEKTYTKDDYDTLMNRLGMDVENTDLIIDLGSVYKDTPETVYLAYRLLLAETPYLDKWRNVVLVASSFPKSVGQSLDKNTKIEFERSEWLAWKKLAKLKNLARVPVFGDYGISHPEIFDDVDPRHIKISASIRYTLEDKWLLIKGESLRSTKGYSQFHDLADRLIAHAGYHGEKASWGDEFIKKCSDPANTKTGSLTTWRQVGNNQHIELVIKQLANLSEKS